MIEEYKNALPEGTIIDTYQIEKILGVGGFGITYLVKELNLGKRYAIKELLPDGIAIRQGGETTVMARSTSDQDGFDATRKYFISEAQVLAGMDHPAVVSVHRLMEANGTCYMVMDYIKGDTLGDYLKKQGGVLSGADEFKQIFFPLMAGLKILHGQGIIHRDIKPGNIMIQPDGAPVLLDFGAATQVQSKTMTITQMLSGGYSPFEQYTTRAKQGPYTDIYALGATMLTSITGKKPDDASDRVYNDQYQPLAENEAYSTVYEKGLLESIDAALLMDAQQRPQNIVAWRGMMERREQKPKLVMAPKPEPRVVPEPESVFDPVQKKEKTGREKMVFLGSVTLIVVCVVVALECQQRRLDPKRQSGVGMVIEAQAKVNADRKERERIERPRELKRKIEEAKNKNAPSKKGTSTSLVIGDAASAAALEKSLELPENTSYLNEEGIDVIKKTVDEYEEFDVVKIENAVKGFMTSGSIQERLTFARDPERVKPLMEKYYGNEEFEPEGFQGINRSRIRYSGNFFTSFVRVGDFSSAPIAVERFEDGDNSSYRVDWESWVGYCEMSAEDLIRAKPTEPKLLRIILRQGSYYNYEYSDERVWAAYRLGFRNNDRTLLAYARRDSKEGEVLAELFRDEEGLPYTLKIRYPENARSGDQVEIVELLAEGWIENLQQVEKKDEREERERVAAEALKKQGDPNVQALKEAKADLDTGFEDLGHDHGGDGNEESGAAEAKRVAVTPGSVSREPPRYPSSSRRAGHQGTTVITFVIGTSGRVTAARVTKSSGHAALDQAAISAVRRWRFTPARNGLGHAVPYTYRQSIPFRLR